MPSGKLREVGHMLKAIHAQESREAAQEKVIAELRRQKLPRAAELVEESIGETLTFYDFPDGQSCLNLAAAGLRHIAGTQWSTRRYMNMAPLYAEQTSTAGAVA